MHYQLIVRMRELLVVFQSAMSEELQLYSTVLLISLLNVLYFGYDDQDILKEEVKTQDLATSWRYGTKFASQLDNIFFHLRIYTLWVNQADGTTFVPYVGKAGPRH
jgi:hypothetical protein